MKFPNNFNLKLTDILKIAGLALAAIIIIALAFRLIGSSFSLLFSETGSSSLTRQGAPAFDANEAYYSKGEVGFLVPPVNGGATIGDDAEEFEVTEYSAYIETRYLEDTCNVVADLKVRDDVIFENANEYERSCNYSFKVKHNSAEEVLVIIEKLDPKELNESVFTIKRLIDDYTSEVEILEKKMKSIEETLTNAVDAYDDITDLATKTQDVESLAKIIDSKIRIIERLTQEKININVQLEQLDRSKAEQLDRLEYTYFSVYVLENKFIDGQNLKDSWKNAIKFFVRDVNEVIQGVTVNLISLLFVVLQYIVYFFVVLIVAKYGWQLARYIWRK